MAKEKKNKRETQSDERTIMRKAWEYVLTLFNLVINCDNLF